MLLPFIGALEGEPCVFIHLLNQQYLLSARFLLITVLSDRDRVALLHSYAALLIEERASVSPLRGLT